MALADAVAAAEKPRARAGLELFYVLADGGSGAAIGEGTLDLTRFLDRGAREPSGTEAVTVTTRQGDELGTLSVRVGGLLDAIDRVRAEGRRPPPPSRDEYTGPPKRVEQLSAAELHSVLIARGVRLPSTASASQRSFYLDKARKERVAEVSAEELNAARRGEKLPLAASIELGVDEISLIDRAIPPHLLPRQMAVRVTVPAGVDHGRGASAPPLETAPFAPPRGAARLEWQETLTLGRNSEAWAALYDGAEAARADATARLDVRFELLDATRGTSLGDGAVDLGPIARSAAAASDGGRGGGGGRARRRTAAAALRRAPARHRPHLRPRARRGRGPPPRVRRPADGRRAAARGDAPRERDGALAPHGGRAHPGRRRRPELRRNRTTRRAPRHDV